MATTEIFVDGIGAVKLYRRRGLKNLRLTVSPAGEVRLNVPWYVPKSAGITYLKSKKDWVKKHLGNTKSRIWEDNQHLSEDYKLRLHESDKSRTVSRISEGELHILLPSTLSDEQKQESLDTHIRKFLKNEAEKILIPYAFELAVGFGAQIKQVRIKHLKSRWGSCNQKKMITLNSSLMQLPKGLCEYVIIHELAHTVHMNHSREFWELVESRLPDYKERRKTLRKYTAAGFF